MHERMGEWEREGDRDVSLLLKVENKTLLHPGNNFHVSYLMPPHLSLALMLRVWSHRDGLKFKPLL